MCNYREINRKVMTDTKHLYETDAELRQMVEDSKNRQLMYPELCYMFAPELPAQDDSQTVYEVTGNRSFAAARRYVKLGKKVAVLNFANNHSVGGAPFSAGAQEESLCRMSTLYPCLEAMTNFFYKRHQQMYDEGEINYMGNDDIIYTPDVCVFKDEGDSDPIIPQLMAREDWYKVDVITCAAPELWHGNPMPADYEQQMSLRIERILYQAQANGADVLILGAWGCGAFKNPEDVVARLFHQQLRKRGFETVEFALGRKDFKNSSFYKEFISECILDYSSECSCNSDSIKNQIESLLRSTDRENIEKVISWLEENNFYEAPASKDKHNNFKGGLAKHSLEVYEEAMKLNKECQLPVNSVIIASLLHDVCKADQYYIDVEGRVASNKEAIDKGHGRRSMFIVNRGCLLPLNYDEEMAIWWHMGEHEKSLPHFPKEFTDSENVALCQLISKADGIAAHKALRQR